jgi:uncharacterized protein (DUF1778 family)
MDPSSRTRNKRLEVRTTAEERALIDQAAIASGTDVTTFVVTSLTDAAQRVLADRGHFTLPPAAAKAWEAVNRRPARTLPGLRRLADRPSPFRG